MQVKEMLFELGPTTKVANQFCKAKVSLCVTVAENENVTTVTNKALRQLKKNYEKTLLTELELAEENDEYANDDRSTMIKRLRRKYRRTKK